MHASSHLHDTCMRPVCTHGALTHGSLHSLSLCTRISLSARASLSLHAQELSSARKGRKEHAVSMSECNRQLLAGRQLLHDRTHTQELQRLMNGVDQHHPTVSARSRRDRVRPVPISTPLSATAAQYDGQEEEWSRGGGDSGGGDGGGDDGGDDGGTDASDEEEELGKKPPNPVLLSLTLASSMLIEASHFSGDGVVCEQLHAASDLLQNIASGLVDGAVRAADEKEEVRERSEVGGRRSEVGDLR